MKVIIDKMSIKDNQTEICTAPVAPGDIPYSVFLNWSQACVIISLIIDPSSNK